MAKEKLSPRQKMINLMYLVFICMLAMQIDQEIIRSYFDTNSSLQESRELTENKTDKIFEQTLKAKSETNEAAAQNYEIYQGLKGKINALVESIEGIKTQLKKEAGYNEKAGVEDNFNALNGTEYSTNKFFDEGDENAPSKVAKDLTKQINDLRTFIAQSFGNVPEMKNLVERANQTMVTEFPKGETRNGKGWLQYKFHNQPLIAALSNLEVIQSEARNLQSDALALMLQEKVDADIKFNAYEAIVAGPSVIIQGQPAEAKVFIGTYSDDPNLQFTGVDRTARGMGYKTLGGGVGEHTISGTISYRNSKG